MPDLTDAQLAEIEARHRAHGSADTRWRGDPLVLALIAEVRRSRPVVAAADRYWQCRDEVERMAQSPASDDPTDWTEAVDACDEADGDLRATLDAYRAAKEAQGA